jgi:[protein-PII] uridylyltransferase
VARPDLLLMAAFLHDIGKGWPGDHSVRGEAVARDVAARVGFSQADAATVAAAVRLHLLLPQAATRRDLDDPVTVAQVAAEVGGQGMLELLHALAVADGQATGPAAWGDWKAGLIADLVHRVSAELDGEPPPLPPPRRPDLLELAAGGGPAAVVEGGEVTVVAAARPGLLWQAAGVLALHRLVVRSANVSVADGTALTVLRVAPEFGDPPQSELVAADLRRMLDGRLDVADRLRRPWSRSARTTSRGCCGVPAARSASAAWTSARPGWRRSARRPWTCSTWWTAPATRSRTCICAG